ncbi:MAG TPA: carboxyltransferase domain-containing protein [Polyangia bacterium]
MNPLVASHVDTGTGGGPGFTITPAGDAALLLRFAPSAEAGDHVHRALAALDRGDGSGWPSGWRDVMPGYASLLIVFDPVACGFAEVAATVSPLVTRALAEPNTGPASSRLHEVPTVYHPDVAPDLLPLAEEKAISVDRLVELHTAATYVCQMLGFRPGFPFLRGLHPTLAAPRLATPRTRVEAGAVGIGGAQTGIYPNPGPGGWRIIGRTPWTLVDGARATADADPAAAFLIRPGDRVRFVPIDRTAFTDAAGVTAVAGAR